MAEPHIITTRLTRSTLASAVAQLALRDNALARIVEAHGVPPLWARRAGFATLARIILEQQVSLAAAKTLYERLGKEFPGGWTPRAILLQGTSGLTGRGVTRQKARYLVALAELVDSGGIVLADLGRASDAEVRRQLMRVPGIGDWTASIYLLLALRRPDVWPAGDLALQKALSKLVGREGTLPSEEAAEWAIRWAPYRAVAARVLWHGYLAER
jgi:DNA-3-methyladenine glycosylase II